MLLRGSAGTLSDCRKVADCYCTCFLYIYSSFLEYSAMAPPKERLLKQIPHWRPQLLSQDSLQELALFLSDRLQINVEPRKILTRSFRVEVFKRMTYAGTVFKSMLTRCDIRSLSSCKLTFQSSYWYTSCYAEACRARTRANDELILRFRSEVLANCILRLLSGVSFVTGPPHSSYS